MKVRVKQNKSGFIYGKLRKEGEEITLKPVKSTLPESDETISAKDQFSGTWMEEVKAKPGPKPKAKKDDE